MITFADFFKKPFSIKATVGYRSIIWGLSLVAMAASYSIENKPIRVVTAAIALIMSMLSLAAQLHRSEVADEMYEKHIGIASNLALSLTMILLIVLGVCSAFGQLPFSMHQVLFFSAGLAGILQGGIFLIFEKIGM